MGGRTPDLSVIVLTDAFPTIQRVTEHLRAQTRADRIELVVGCPSPRQCVVPPEAVRGLARVTVVQTLLLPMGVARAAAIRAATAPLVVLGETHAFPAPDWAEHLVRAHEGPWDAVAPGMMNANGESALSWSGLLMDYGRWLAGRPEGMIDEPPAYNACWKRDVLLATGECMARFLEPGAPLNNTLGARGARFHHAPNAKVAHLNVRRAGPWAAERCWAGRLFGARRSRGWPMPRCIVYGAGSVLVPVIRFVRTRPAIALARRSQSVPRGTAAAVAAASLFWAAGEAMGYLAGEGRAEAKMSEFELHKERYA